MCSVMTLSMYWMKTSYSSYNFYHVFDDLFIFFSSMSGFGRYQPRDVVLYNVVIDVCIYEDWWHMISVVILIKFKVW